MTQATTLLLLPGLDGTEIFFQPLLRALPESVRPVVVQYPATGDNRYEQLLTIIRQVTAGLPEYYVLGWSFSGPLALMLAAAEPDRVRGVILCATFVRSPRWWLRWAGFALAGPAMWCWRAGRRLPLWLFRPASDPLRAAKMQTWQRISAGVLARRLRMLARVDAQPELRGCRVPILYLASSHDAIVPPRNLQLILAEQPSVQIATIQGGHLALYTNPQPAAHTIVTFLAGPKPELARRPGPAPK